MDIKKLILYAIIIGLGFYLVNLWDHDYRPHSSKTESSIIKGDTASVSSTTAYTPPPFQAKTEDVKYTHHGKANHVTIPMNHADAMINIETDVLNIKIDEASGNIASVQLKKYPVSTEDKNIPIQILNSDPHELYVIQNGITQTSPLKIQYTSKNKEYLLDKMHPVVSVVLEGHSSQGLQVRKTYTFSKGRYTIPVAYYLINQSNKPWTGSVFSQIVRHKPSSTSHFLGIKSYNAASISTPNVPYKKLSYSSLDEKNVDETIKNGWIAMQQHYFLVAAIPPKNQSLHYYSQVHSLPSSSEKNIYSVGFVTPQITLMPNQDWVEHTQFYVGPEIATTLKRLAPGLERTVDYGWLWPISVLLFWIMSLIHTVVRNWGIAIIITTIVIKIVFYWFSAKSFRSMARMREIQPRLQAMKERYADDRQGLSRATMELYRQEKINPVGGCLPMIIQIPVFIAFYSVIIESVQLRQAPFMLWIQDLSAKDPYYILPIIMGLTMLLQQHLSPAVADPTQKKMMWLLPIVFTMFFINFPTGLVLYWITNNLVQTLQQWYVNKTYESHKMKLKHKRVKNK